MSYVTFGRYSLNIEMLAQLSIDEAYETFHKLPKNVVLAAWESVNGKVKKTKKKPKTEE